MSVPLEIRPNSFERQIMQVVVSSRRHHHLKIQSVLMALCGSDVITQHVCQIDTEAQLRPLVMEISPTCVYHILRC
jgi:hypothetical protein